MREKQPETRCPRQEGAEVALSESTLKVQGLLAFYRHVAVPEVAVGFESKIRKASLTV